MYLKKDGTKVDNLPDLDDYVKDDPDMVVEMSYIVELYGRNNHLLECIEHGNTYPNESKRRFYLLKNPEAEFISVKRVYRGAYR